MNFIPKEIKEYLEGFKKSFKKLHLGSNNVLDLNYSKILQNQKFCNCDTKISCSCPNISYVDIILQSSTIENNRDFILYIKELNIKFNIESGIFDLVLVNGDQTYKQIILKGIIHNKSYSIYNYSYPIKINLPNKLFLIIILVNNNDKELYIESSNIINLGIINFGLIIQ